MDLKEIKAVIDLMTRNGLTEFELEKGDFKIRVKRGPTGEWITSTAPAAAAPAHVSHSAPAATVSTVSHAAPAPSAPAPAGSAGAQIVSPMVGTFYRSPSPDSAPYIEPGQEVNEDTVVLHH